MTLKLLTSNLHRSELGRIVLRVLLYLPLPAREFLNADFHYSKRSRQLYPKRPNSRFHLFNIVGDVIIQ